MNHIIHAHLLPFEQLDQTFHKHRNVGYWFETMGLFGIRLVTTYQLDDSLFITIKVP